MAFPCPRCRRDIKAHKFGTRILRALTPKERRSTIASATRWLKEMRRIHEEMKHQGR